MSLDDPSEEDEFSDLTLNGRRFQDKISAFMSGGMTSPSLDRSSRPASSVSLRSGDNTSELRAELDRLQARLEATENENERLRNTSENSESTISDRLTALVDERDKVQARVAELETSLRSKERLLNERDVKVEGLERAAKEAVLDLEKAKNDSESRTRDLISKLEDSETLISHLKEIVEAKEGEQSENNAALAVKNAEITMLESRVEKACTELEEERRILNGQVDELRKAGQVRPIEKPSFTNSRLFFPGNHRSV